MLQASLVAQRYVESFLVITNICSLLTQILYAVLFSLPFTGIRMMYGVVSILAPSKNLNPTNGAIGFRISLSFIPELIAILAFVYVGLATHTLRRDIKNTVEREVQPAHRYREDPSKLERGV
jgi:hypothetical protein